MNYIQAREIERRMPPLGWQAGRVARLLVAQSEEARKRGREWIMPRQATIAAEIGCSVRTVIRAMKKLVESGLFQLQVRYRRARDRFWRMSNKLRLVIDTSIECGALRTLAAFPVAPLSLNKRDRLGGAVTRNNYYKSVRTGAGSLYATLMLQGLGKKKEPGD